MLNRPSLYARRSAISYAECRHCGAVYVKRRASRAADVNVCRAAECRRVEHARRMRDHDYNARSRAKLGRPASTRAADSKRRALDRGATAAESLVPADIFDRDGWVCGICDAPIDPTQTFPAPASVSIDHIVPVSKGGDHVAANVRAAHLGCNSARGARVA